MKNILIIALLFCIASTGYSQETWETYSIPSSEFTVKLPGEPERGVKSTESNELKIDMEYMIVETDTISFFAFYSIFPPNYIDFTKKELFYQKAVDTVLNKIGGKLIFQNIDSIDGHEGVYIKVKLKESKSVLYAKIFLVGERLVQLLAICPNSFQNSIDIVKFFESFKVSESIVKDQISSLLDHMGFEYDKNDDGEFHMTITYSEDNRSQLLYISPSVLTYDGRLYYDIWSPIAEYSLFLPDTISQLMLERNNNYEMGSYQSLIMSDTTYLLVYGLKLTEAIDTTNLKKAIFFVSEIGDNMEIKLNDKDVY